MQSLSRNRNVFVRPFSFTLCQSSADFLQFDILINGQPAGRIIFRLYDDQTPSTARNFRELATGQHGYGYEGSPIHRVIPDVRPFSVSLSRV